MLIHSFTIVYSFVLEQSKRGRDMTTSVDAEDAAKKCQSNYPECAPSLVCEPPNGDLYSFKSSMCDLSSAVGVGITKVSSPTWAGLVEQILISAATRTTRVQQGFPRVCGQFSQKS